MNILNAGAQAGPVLSKEMISMCLCRAIVATIAVACVVAAAGCRQVGGPEAVLGNVVFPNEWVGDIDPSGFNEPSGMCWHPQRRTLFVVGDEG